MGSKSIRGAQMSQETSLMRGEENSDEGDPYRDSGRLCPVLRRVMGNHMFHHCVFRHVLYKVRLLEKKQNKRKTTLEHITAAVSSDLKNCTWSLNSLRCTPGRTCCSSTPWRF